MLGIHTKPQPETATQNGVYKSIFKNAPIRLAVTDMTEGWPEMTEFHKYPLPVLVMLGEFAAGTLLLASTIKFEGSVVLQIQGSGPVSFLIVEVKNSCEIRCMAKVRNDAEVKHNAQVQDLINVDGKGKCVMILDPISRKENEPPYQGVVELKGLTVADILENYMLTSEQLQTRLKLAADKTRIAGILLQKMPETGGDVNVPKDTDAWNRNCQLLSTVKQKELLKPNHMPKLLHSVFWQEALLELSFTAVKFACGCTREKTDNMLRSLGQQEVEDILKAEGKVEVRCHFCNKVQTYTPEQAEALFTEPGEFAPLAGANPDRPQ